MTTSIQQAIQKAMPHIKNPPVLCDYDDEPAELVTGEEIYPHRPDLYDKSFWRCSLCMAFVGCHPGTNRPLGRLANAELRRAKMEAHAAFDPIWKGGSKKRGSAYAWLSDALGIPQKDCHIGMMDLDTCRRVVEVCAAAEDPNKSTQ